MNDSNISSPVYVLTAELWIQYLLFYIIMEAAAICLNIFIAWMIFHNNKLKTFFFAFLAGHSMALALYSSESMVLGIYRISAYHNPALFTITRLQCHTLHVLVIVFASLSSVTMFLLAADRLYSLWKPLSYRSRSFKHGIHAVLLALVFVIVTKFFPSYTGSVPFSKIILCTTAVAPFSEEVWTYNYGMNLFLMFVSLSMYVILGLVAYFRKRIIARGGAVNEAAQIKRQLKLLNVILSLIILYCFTVVPYNILLMMSFYFEPKISSKMVVYGACLNMIDTLLDPLVLFYQSSEIRKAFRARYGKANAIGHIALLKKSNTTDTTKEEQL